MDSTNGVGSYGQEGMEQRKFNIDFDDEPRESFGEKDRRQDISNRSGHLGKLGNNTFPSNGCPVRPRMNSLDPINYFEESSIVGDLWLSSYSLQIWMEEFLAGEAKKMGQMD